MSFTQTVKGEGCTDPATRPAKARLLDQRHQRHQSRQQSVKQSATVTQDNDLTPVSSVSQFSKRPTSTTAASSTAGTAGINPLYEGIGVIPSTLIPPSVRSAVSVLHESTQHPRPGLVASGKRSSSSAAANLIKNCLITATGSPAGSRLVAGSSVVSSSHPPASCQAWTKDNEESSFIGLSDPVTQTLEEIMEIKRQLARPDIHHNMHAKTICGDGSRQSRPRYQPEPQQQIIIVTGVGGDQFSRSLSTGNTVHHQQGGHHPGSNSTSTVQLQVQGVGGDHLTSGIPGSPYRTSSTGGGLHYAASGSGLLNGFGGSGSTPPSAKPSLSKELMQKLRSMTETIKMLSDENEILKRENERIKDEEEGVYVVKQSKVLGHQNVGNVGVLPDASSNQKTSGSGEYEQMTRSQLVSLTLSYDKKVKKLSEDIKTLQAEMSVTNKPDSGLGKPGAGPGPEGGGGKDKYKTLARRLKEERNQYRETCEEKQKEQDELKNEMEKMSELIAELRENCQKLQTELLESKNNFPLIGGGDLSSAAVSTKPAKRDTSTVGIQVSLINPDGKGGGGRRSSSTSITSESVKKARSVYGAKQPKPRYHSTSGAAVGGSGAAPLSNSSSVSSLRAGEHSSQPATAAATSGQTSTVRNTRTVSLSPMKRPTTSVATPSVVGTNKHKATSSLALNSNQTAATRTHQSLRNGGPKFAKPVTKPQSQPHSSIGVSSNISSPSPRPMTSPLPSKLPQPTSGSAGVGSKIPAPSPLRKSRIPSAPRYNPPQKNKIKGPDLMVAQRNSPAKAVVTPVSKVASSAASVGTRYTPSPPPPPPPSTQVGMVDSSRSPTATPSPPPPPVSNQGLTHQVSDDTSGVASGLGYDDDDVLCVHPDGQVEIRPSSGSTRASSSVDHYLKPAHTGTHLPDPPTYTSPNLNNNFDRNRSSSLGNNNTEIHHHPESSGCSGTVSSADDEGSRDGEEEDLRRNYQQQQARHGSQVTGHEGSASPPTLNSPSPTHYTKDNNHESSSNEGTTPKAKKKPERRVHRTWKHFYQELEERKESVPVSNSTSPAKLSVIEEPVSDNGGEGGEGSINSKASSPATANSGSVTAATTTTSGSSPTSGTTPSPPPCTRVGSADIKEDPPTAVPVTKTAPAPELKTSAASDQLQSTSVTTTEDGSSNSNSTETVVDNKAASSKNSSAATFLGHDDEEEDAVSFIQAALRAHDLRSRTLSGVGGRSKIHTARPWLKKKPALAPSLSLNETESSEEEPASVAAAASTQEIDMVCRSIQGVLKSHDVRMSAMERLEADKELFTSGKVNAIKAKFNTRRAAAAAAAAASASSAVERSDGVTDDDDDVVY